MQTVGMLIGGHSHQHKPLATLSDEELHWDLSTCQRLLTEHLQPQTYWPFCYPYGQKDSFSDLTVTQLKQLGFTCAFSTEVGGNTLERLSLPSGALIAMTSHRHRQVSSHVSCAYSRIGIIGRRHLGNLRQLGVQDILLYRTRPELLPEAPRVTCFYQFTAGPGSST